MAHGYLTVANGFTIECWFRRSTAPTSANYELLFGQTTQANPVWNTNNLVNGRQLWFGCYATTGAFYLHTYTEAGVQMTAWIDPSPSGYQNDNEWHHVAVRLGTNKTTWTVFLDGQVLATVTGAAAADWKPGVLSIGGTYAPHLGNFGAYLWTEGLAMVAATNKALSNNRILEHYTAGAGGTVYYGDNEVQRMNRIFDWTDTPVPCRDLDANLSVLQGIAVAGTNALDALLDTAEAASGYVFADGQTWIQYHNKRHRYNRFSVFTFAESLGSAVDAGIDFITDEERIYNDVRGKRPYGGSYRMRDSVSVDEYGRRTYEFTLPITSSEELRNTVGWILSRYGQEHLRVAGVSLSAESSAVLEAATTGRIEIGDRVVIDELPDWAPVSRLEMAVEGMSLEADFVEETWRMSFNLSPAEFDQVFQIGVSRLGGTDRIAL